MAIIYNINLGKYINYRYFFIMNSNTNLQKKIDNLLCHEKLTQDACVL